MILIGNIGRNPDVVAFPQERNNDSGNMIKKASFTLATTETHRNREGIRFEQTEWHNVVCWRNLAEIAEKILRKGVTVYVEGRLQTRSWEDKEGNKRYITEVVADNFTVLSGRTHNDDSGNSHPEGSLRPESRNTALEEILTTDTEPLGDLPF